MRPPFRYFWWPLKDMPTSFYVNKTSKTLHYIKDKQLKLFWRWMCFVADWSITYIRVILILIFFLFLTWTYLQVVPFCSLISKLFLFFMYDPSFHLPWNFSASMGISMRKWPKSIKWPKIAFPGSKRAPKVPFLVPPKKAQNGSFWVFQHKYPP